MASFLNELKSKEFKIRAAVVAGIQEIHLKKSQFEPIDDEKKSSQDDGIQNDDDDALNELDLPDPPTTTININDDNTDENKEEKQDDNPILSVVHISDTHLKHRSMQSIIPFGDILIHSGDFVQKCNWSINAELNISGNDVEKHIIKNNITSMNELKKYIPEEILDFNEWLAKLPHRHKIVIGGNHERCFNQLTASFIQKYVLTNCIYLQDSFTKLYGLKIFGTPWTTSSKVNGFSYRGNKKFLYSKWDAIPSDTDILITHLPPYSVLDLAWGSKYNFKQKCNLCNKKHAKYKHWGDKNLLQQVCQRIKPRLHLFGHVHDEIGQKYDKKSNVLFINSAMDIARKPHKIKLIFDL